MISIEEQFKIGGKCDTTYEAIEMMNKSVEPCKPKPKIFGIIPRSLHNFEDYTHCLDTVTYTLLYRCSDCGFFELRSGI